MSGRNTLIFAAGTLLSRVLGLARDIMWVLYIPAASRDAFLVGFRFPNMLRDLVGEGAANAAFVPIFAQTLETKSSAEYRNLVSASMSAMLILLAAMTGIGMFLLPGLLTGLDTLSVLTRSAAVSPERTQQYIEISLWTFPYIFMIGMTVFCSGPLFAAGRYSVPSWSPAILNVALIAACVFFHDAFADPAYAPVVGVWIGGIATLLIQYYAMARASGVWLPNFKLNNLELKSIFLLLIPVVLGQGAGELNKLVDLLFAASLPVGTVTVLYYANRLVQLPLSIFGVATQVAILPVLSRAHVRGDFQEGRTQLLGAINQCAFLVLPAAVGLITLAEPIVRMLFEYAHFTPEDTRMTANALVIYAVGLSIFAIVKVAVAGFYARQNTRLPVIVATGAMLLNILLNCALVGPLGYIGLALGTTISYAVNLGLLLVFLNDAYQGLYDKERIAAFGRMILAAAMMAAVVYGLHIALDQNFGHDTALERALTTIPPIAIGALSYLGLAAALNVNEMATFLHALRRR